MKKTIVYIVLGWIGSILLQKQGPDVLLTVVFVSTALGYVITNKFDTTLLFSTGSFLLIDNAKLLLVNRPSSFDFPIVFSLLSLGLSIFSMYLLFHEIDDHYAKKGRPYLLIALVIILTLAKNNISACFLKNDRLLTHFQDMEDSNVESDLLDRWGDNGTDRPNYFCRWCGGFC